MKIKICGMKERENIRAIATLQPDYLGFIFHKESPRYAGMLDPETTGNLPPAIKKTGVFVNEELQVVIDTALKYNLDLLQLHGSETAQYCHALSVTGLPLIKSFGIDGQFDFEQLEQYERVCDYFLFDTRTTGHGGSGKKFDWRLLQNRSWRKPIFLSGGIGAEDLPALKNIGIAIHAADINSRFETSPGIKDRKKIEQLLKQLR